MEIRKYLSPDFPCDGCGHTGRIRTSFQMEIDDEPFMDLCPLCSKVAETQLHRANEQEFLACQECGKLIREMEPGEEIDVALCEECATEFGARLAAAPEKAHFCSPPILPLSGAVSPRPNWTCRQCGRVWQAITYPFGGASWVEIAGPWKR